MAPDRTGRDDDRPGAGADGRAPPDHGGQHGGPGAAGVGDPKPVEGGTDTVDPDQTTAEEGKDTSAEIPEGNLDEAVRLARLASRTVDEDEAAAYREARDAVVADHGFRARVRHEESRSVLVCYPAEWIVDGTVRPARIDDLDRAIERPLDGGGGEADWEAVDARNRAVVEAVKSTAGPVHGANVAAFADYLGNHHVCAIADATAVEVDGFLAEYFPRNAWPSDDQRAVVRESLALAFEAAGVKPPGPLR